SQRRLDLRLRRLVVCFYLRQQLFLIDKLTQCFRMFFAIVTKHFIQVFVSTGCVTIVLVL
ncbi:hypothetical protein D039_2893B, partial [Vibrio parahaemolyticus EKP-028]